MTVQEHLKEVSSALESAVDVLDVAIQQARAKPDAQWFVDRLLQVRVLLTTVPTKVH